METKSSEVSLTRKTSSMWYFFTILEGYIARCKTCGKSLSYRSSTSNLKKHLQKKHRSIFELVQSGKIPSTYKADGSIECDLLENFDDLDEPYNDDNDEEYTPDDKRPHFQIKDVKSLRSVKLHSKSVAGKKLSNSRLPMVGSGSDDEEDNEYNLLGKYICSQLQKLSKVNAFLAQEEIQSVLTRYKVHELSTEEKSKMMPNVKL